jgi:hypothetical protein
MGWPSTTRCLPLYVVQAHTGMWLACIYFQIGLPTLKSSHFLPPPSSSEGRWVHASQPSNGVLCNLGTTRYYAPVDSNCACVLLGSCLPPAAWFTQDNVQQVLQWLVAVNPLFAALAAGGGDDGAVSALFTSAGGVPGPSTGVGATKTIRLAGGVLDCPNVVAVISPEGEESLWSAYPTRDGASVAFGWKNGFAMTLAYPCFFGDMGKGWGGSQLYGLRRVANKLSRDDPSLRAATAAAAVVARKRRRDEARERGRQCGVCGTAGHVSVQCQESDEDAYHEASDASLSDGESSEPLESEGDSDSSQHYE